MKLWMPTFSWVLLGSILEDHMGEKRNFRALGAVSAGTGPVCGCTCACPCMLFPSPPLFHWVFWCSYNLMLISFWIKISSWWTISLCTFQPLKDKKTQSLSGREIAHPLNMHKVFIWGTLEGSEPNAIGFLLRNVCKLLATTGRDVSVLKRSSQQCIWNAVYSFSLSPSLRLFLSIKFPFF